MQKPYYNIQRQMTINHFGFQSIILKNFEIRLKMIIYVVKYLYYYWNNEIHNVFHPLPGYTP